MPKAKDRLLAIDSNALIHRAYHALPPLTAKDGRPAGALYGVCLTLLNVLKGFKPTHVIAAFDRPEKTFRHEQFEAYKAQRKATPEDLVEQIIRARDIFTAFGISVVDVKGFEADDIIGSVTARAEKGGIDSIIVTGDQDTMQLISEKTRVFMLRRGVKDTVTMGPSEVKERYGLTVDQMIDYKALRGDPSDNIPGVRGVGEKTATELLQKYKTLKGVYEHLDELPETLRKKLAEGKKDALASQKLVTIRRTVPLGVPFDTFSWTTYDRSKAIVLLQELGFASLLPRIPDAVEKKEDKKKQQGTLLGEIVDQRAKRRTPGYTLVQTAGEAKNIASTLAKSKGFVMDTETDVLGARTAALHGISLSIKEGEAWYIPTELVDLFKPVLESSKVPKWGHNLKYDAQALQQVGIYMAPMTFDTMLASYILAPGTRAHSLDTLAFTVLGHEMIPIEALIGKKASTQKKMSEVPLDDVAEYSAEDADYTLRLKHHFEGELKKIPSLEKVFREIEMPLVPVLTHMELAGVKLDTAFLKKLSTQVGKKLTTLEKSIHAAAGGPFNVNSPAQLREILFDRMKLSTVGIGRTQTGLSTAAEELDKLKDAHPIIPMLVEYRELSKLQGTYLEALPELVDKETGRVYTNYNQTIAATGRLSSADPNLQNIPIRTELGGEIRKAFTAEPGHVLVAADYSQIELRLAAHIANDRVMRETFQRGRDIHTETAAFAYKIPAEQVTKSQRRSAKTLNFGVLYGMGPQAFARTADISLGEAQKFIAEYMRMYRGIAEYMEEAKAKAGAEGFVETLYGRRRYLPEIQSRNPQIRSGAERAAINHPIQGTASDIMKRAMIAVFEAVHQEKGPFNGAKMTLQVHDELVFEVPEKNAEALARAVKKIMEGMEKLSVPLVVDMRIGKTWGEMETLHV